MMQAEGEVIHHLTWTIGDWSTDRGGDWEVQAFWNGESLGQPHRVSRLVYQTMHRLVESHRRHLIQRGHPQLAADMLWSAGVELFNVWLAPFWPLIRRRRDRLGLTRPVRLMIAADRAELLLQPWELLHAPGGGFFGLDEAWQVRRLPGLHGPALSGERCDVTGERPLRRPLRILAQVSGPSELAQIAVEEERAALTRAVALAGPLACLHWVESGDWESLATGIRLFQPQIVHWIGHGVIHREQGFFCFEDDQGENDPRGAAQMAKEVLVGTGVQCLLVSGRSGDHSPPVAAVQALGRGVVAAGGVPLAVSWPETMTEPTACAFLSAFYLALAEGEGIDRGLTKARLAMREACDREGYPGWTLPVLYAAGH